VVKIRLRRMGAKKRPFYRLVVADSRSPRDGRFIEQLGIYDPLSEPATIRIDEDKVKQWLSHGAQPSEAARSLLRREGILPAVIPTGPPKKSPASKKAEKAAKAAEAAGPAPVETKVEAPAAEEGEAAAAEAEVESQAVDEAPEAEAPEAEAPEVEAPEAEAPEAEAPGKEGEEEPNGATRQQAQE